MPLAYPAGTIAEHLACRTDAVVFDVPPPRHRAGRRAPDAFERLQCALTNDLARSAAAGPSTRTCSTRPTARCSTTSSCGGSTTSAFDVMPNASNTDAGASTRSAAPTTHARPGRARRAGPAGPRAAGDGVARGRRRRPLPRRPGRVGRRAACVVAGTGYTGEDGVEIAVPADAAGRFWDAVLAAGIEPAGLGRPRHAAARGRAAAARPRARPGITPLQAGLGWVVGWEKGEFRGRAALEAERERGVARRLVGMLVEGRRPPRAGSRCSSTASRSAWSPAATSRRARPRHRPRLPAARRRGRRRRRRSTCAAPAPRPGRRDPVRVPSIRSRLRALCRAYSDLFCALNQTARCQRRARRWPLEPSSAGIVDSSWSQTGSR